MGDFNSDVRKGKILQICNRKNLNEKILSKHGKNPPATYERNMNRTPIDGIIGSRSSHFSESGYLGFGEGFDTDHRILWVKTQEKEIFGGKIQKANKRKLNRLKTEDPRLVKKYNKKVHQQFTANYIYDNIEILSQKAEEEWSPELEEQYNKIHIKTVDIRKKIEKQLKKIGNGTIPWSPKIKQICETIKYWRLSSKQKKTEKSKYKNNI